jgi:tRNA A-37 threonylcarbamoyl transferase component Bud32
MRSRLLHAASPRWAAAAASLDVLMAESGWREVKRTARGRAGFLEIDGQRCFIKQAAEGPFVKGLVARVRGSRAQRILRGARMLAAAGFAHPRPLIAVEEREHGTVRASWVASEALPDARVMSMFMLGDGRNFRRRQWVSRLVACEIRRLHDAGIYTLDMQETNLMLEATGGEPIIYFLDLEDFRRVRRVRWEQRMINLVHLDRSIGRFASRSQRLRFLYNYLGCKPSRFEIRKLARHLLELRQRRDRRKGSGSGAAAAGRPVTEPVNPMRAATGKQQWRSRY